MVIDDKARKEPNDFGMMTKEMGTLRKRDAKHDHKAVTNQAQ